MWIIPFLPTVITSLETALFHRMVRGEDDLHGPAGAADRRRTAGAGELAQLPVVASIQDGDVVIAVLKVKVQKGQAGDMSWWNVDEPPDG